MAEAPAGFDIRRILLIGGVVVVVAFSLLFFLIRGCGPATTAIRKPGYTLIYSSLDLRDAANAIARLKELAIPYEIRDEGRAIAVPKEKADQARLGLAEKNLPAGGVVGWEIFDEARLGATDFDRRIQLIRAISGELARTIRRIEGVEDARVQVVIPETKLFAAAVAPVTASVMLRLRPAFELASEKINGIVHLVASSVENLQPENVTVVDDTGRILTAKVRVPELKLAPAPPPAEVVVKIVSPEIPASQQLLGSPEVVVAVSPEVKVSPEVTAEERILLKAQAKKELEQDLSGKAQELLNRFYPINSAIVRVTVDKKIYAVILIDNRIDLTPSLKQATFTTVAAAINYDKKRGDRIVLQKVPFHLAAPSPEAVARVEKKGFGVPFINLRYLLWLMGAVLIIIAVFWIVNTLRRTQQLLGSRVPEVVEEAAPRAAPPLARERVSMLNQVKTMADRNPERIAELLKSWLSE